MPLEPCSMIRTGPTPNFGNLCLRSDRARARRIPSSLP
nr:MAG TPA: hypothetical protein [Caudoviricetes sp.]